MLYLTSLCQRGAYKKWTFQSITQFINMKRELVFTGKCKAI